MIPADSLRLQFYDGTRWQESWSSVQAIPLAVRMTPAFAAMGRD
ncbi:hypothetical protein ACLK1T_17760 [Escherichia coli]